MTSDTAQTAASTKIPALKGSLPWVGHMVPFAMNPYLFTKKVADKLGEIASFKLLGQKIILLTGDEASRLFYRGSDEELDQSAAYKLMTPIFGEGLIFDAPIKRKNEQLKMLMPSLRVEAMRQHSFKIVQEVEDIISDWGSSGEVEIVEFMKRLTINTASHCLLGKEFRYELNEQFAEIYHDLEQGISPIAYHFPNLPIPKFRRRDRARKKLQKLVGDIVEKRKQQTEKPSDMFQTLIDMKYDDGSSLNANEITGLLVGAIFAGHHTSSGTSAWVLLELLKNPHLMREVVQELDDLLGSDGAVTFQSLREMPKLESVLKEVLRLHPPLIILMRQVSQTMHFKDYQLNPGDMVWACPPVTHRQSKHFSNPEVFDPDRFSPERAEDRNNMAYQPFGGGKHKCSGNAFAMFQIKAIFAILLRRYEFELVDSPEQYKDNYKEMIVQPTSPCKVRFKKRDLSTFKSKYGSSGAAAEQQGCPMHEQAAAPACPAHAAAKPESVKKPEVIKKQVQLVELDQVLCQGHGMCTGEAPDYFKLEESGELNILKAEVDKNDLEKIQAAIKFCPNQALSLTEKTVETA